MDATPFSARSLFSASILVLYTSSGIYVRIFKMLNDLSPHTDQMPHLACLISQELWEAARCVGLRMGGSSLSRRFDRLLGKHESVFL
ncbi:hypothetical protein BCR33DRAFT_370084 [Rhizoclosmatium globosum]|uniref:Uncharacterized protein n=1 Tax=Rhizoclosmatium globosum TaxID=329046 RepID=A0A1Y2BZC9_9FUNG|nr:hypothetical protein BCR33DRAFT_370084 [Rhizoclosmatium globosum]|eukprot:ORY40119.1 hypothetical protein BCR33DRAFT_370084 [Rhizoclosmatium globosum]